MNELSVGELRRLLEGLNPNMGVKIQCRSLTGAYHPSVTNLFEASHQRRNDLVYFDKGRVEKKPDNYSELDEHFFVIDLSDRRMT